MSETKLRVLDVGGFLDHNTLSGDYKDWERITLNINPNDKPDICMDAIQLETIKTMAEQYDAVFCSHMLEHIPRRDQQKLLRGFRHVIKANGWVDIVVPNILKLIKEVALRNLELDSVIYNAPCGAVTVQDMLWGLGNTRPEIRFDNEFMAHKFGFCPKTLVDALHKADFGIVDDYTDWNTWDIRVVAYP